MDEFDLEKSIFKADEIDIENLTAEITQSKRSADTVELVRDTTTSSEMAFDLGVNEITLKDINARYNHRATGQVASLKLEELVLDAEDIDLKNRSINLNEFRLHDTFVSYQQLAGYHVPTPRKTIVPVLLTTMTPGTSHWKIGSGKQQRPALRFRQTISKRNI